MFYHASSISGLQILVPYTSGHTKALVYFSEKMENTLVYLSNPVERYCKEIGYEHSGRYYRFMSYRFTKDNILEILEYWPNALEETYMGVSGYIYGVMQIPNAQMIEMPYVIASETPISIESYEYIPDAYLAIMQAEKEKKIKIVRYHENSVETLEKIEGLVCREYEKAQTIPEYKVFLEAKFQKILKE